MSHVADQSSGSTPTSPQFAATLQRAFVYAEEQAQRLVTAEHLLLALTEDPDAVAVLRRKAIDLDHMRNEIAGLVSRNNDRFAYGDAGHPMYGADLLRVLNTASGGASARRPIDGALVLAAVIAEGRTPAAELVRLYGLTFEDASRMPPPAPAPPAPPANPVQSLSSLRSAARESALGYRKRPNSQSDDDLADDTVPLPLPLPQESPALSLRRPVSQLNDRPSTQDWGRADLPVSMNGAAEANGLWPENGRQGAANGEWPGEFKSGSQAASYGDQRPGGEEPNWSEYDRPDPQSNPISPIEAPRNHPQGFSTPESPLPLVRYRDRRGLDDRQPPGTAKPKGRKSGSKARRATEPDVLVENIPRRMLLGRPVMVEARVAKHHIQTILNEADNYSEASLGDPRAAVFTHAIAVRLRSIDGAISVEAGSPETQWVDAVLSVVDEDHASWRWTVTPRVKGTTALQLLVSGRAVGLEGPAIEMALPDQIVDVQVTASFGPLMRRAATRVGLAVGAVVLGIVGEHWLHVVSRLLGH